MIAQTDPTESPIRIFAKLLQRSDGADLVEVQPMILKRQIVKRTRVGSDEAILVPVPKVLNFAEGCR